MIARCLTFDLTFTLIKVNGGVGHQYARILRKFDYQLDADLATTNFRRHYKSKNNECPMYGYSVGMSSRQWWKDIVKSVIMDDAKSKSIKCPDERSLENMSEAAFDEFSEAECWEEYPNCRSTLEYLANKGVKLGMISNFDERIGLILKSLDLEKYFDFVVIPYETNGIGKPNREIFERGLKLSGGSNPEAIVHVGNDIDLDYYAAVNAGYRSLLISHDPQPSVVDPRLDAVIQKGHFSNSFKSLLKLIDFSQ